MNERINRPPDQPTDQPTNQPTWQPTNQQTNQLTIIQNKNIPLNNQWLIKTNNYRQKSQQTSWKNKFISAYLWTSGGTVMGGLTEDEVTGGKLEADGRTVNVKENVEMRWKSAIIFINMFLI